MSFTPFGCVYNSFVIRLFRIFISISCRVNITSIDNNPSSAQWTILDIPIGKSTVVLYEVYFTKNYNSLPGTYMPTGPSSIPSTELHYYDRGLLLWKYTLAVCTPVVYALWMPESLGFGSLTIAAKAAENRVPGTRTYFICMTYEGGLGSQHGSFHGRPQRATYP